MTTRESNTREFTLWFPELEALQRVFESIRKVTSEVMLHMTPNGIELKDMDLSRICLFRIFIPSNTAESYEMTLEKSILFLNNDDLCQKTLDTFPDKKASLCIYKYLEDNKNQVWFEAGAFKISLEELDPVEREIVPLKNLRKTVPTASLTIKNTKIIQKLLQALKFCKQRTEVFSIIFKESEFSLSSSLEAAIVRFHDTEYSDYIIEQEFSNHYSIEFLEPLLEPLAEDVEQLQLSTKEDAPLKILATLQNGVEFEFYLAPRVEEADWEDEDEDEEEKERGKTTESERQKKQRIDKEIRELAEKVLKTLDIKATMKAIRYYGTQEHIYRLSKLEALRDV